MTHSRGFTLIEILITVALLGIALAIAVPSLTSWILAARTKGVAENLAQDIVMARAEAIRTNKPIRMNIQVASSSCYGFSTNPLGCNCTKTSSTDSAFCEVKREGEWHGVSISLDSGQFNNIIFDSTRGLPVTNAFGILPGTQTAKISSSSGQVNVNMTVIGGLCLSSPSSAKLTGYPDAC
ncbi:GspH/FimT family pseudopilin [Chitinolyticbacter albus]|uniref:GspH/FimT family pseudopilin n=1 Tax=Chitinolyticbacter albus TaxID=2961951 RepID=UPI00210DAEF3|nr:GspH/FimT family pseudopilin [Chitinolyticbacter albus]